MNRVLALLALSALALPARAYDTIRFLAPIASPEMSRPSAVAADGDRLFVADEKKDRILVFDDAGALVKTVGERGRGDGQFDAPRGLAVGPTGKVYVADTGNDRVQILDRDGKFLSAFGAKGSEPGRLRSPRSVAVGADGRIYVADTGNDRVQVFTDSGILLFVLGRSGKEAGQFRSPTRVCVDPSDGIYVLDSGNDRVQVFDASAKLERTLSLSGDDMVVDAYGFLYMLEGREGKVAEVSPKGQVLGRFGSYGRDAGQMKKAQGIGLASDGTLVIADTGNDRLQRAKLTNKLKTAPLPLDARTKVSVAGPSRSWPVKATMLAPLGDEVYAYAPDDGPFVVLDANGKETARFGKRGKGDDETRSAGGIAVSAKLGFYASDRGGDRLQRFEDRTWKANVGEKQGFFDSRKKDGRVRDPRGVAINDAGTVYVADAGNRRIDAFGPNGVFLFAIGPTLGSYELQEPVAPAWDPEGFLYFADKGLKKVFKCDPSGAVRAVWGSEGRGPGQFESPVSVAFDGRNYVYTLDSELRRVSVYQKDGHWLTDFFAGGRGERELDAPSAIAVQGDRLLIADPGQGRIETYDLHPMLGAPVGISSSTKEGIVSLSWDAVDDPWTDGYEVYRASREAGPYDPVGKVEKTEYQDSDVGAYATYWYRVATRAKTGDLGPWSRPVATFVSAAFNRAPVEISTVTLGDLFAAKYKWYLTHPVGEMAITNNVNVPFLNVKATFKLKDYMDFGFDTEIKKLEPKQTVTIPLIATLNNKVLEVAEDTPIQAEFSLSYFDSGKAQTASLTKPLRLYSRNAIVWDDPAKLASFVTYKDDPVKSLAAADAAAASKEAGAGSTGLNENAVKAMRSWNALGAYGLRFAANPANPFETAHDDPNFPVDYTQYPRETLKRRAGQCSDLASLYASLLIDDEIRVALLDYPGHITLMFDTEAPDAASAGLPPDLLVAHEGTMWLPVEVTYVGKPFYDAVSKAAFAYKAEAAKGRVRIVDLDKAFATYEPVTMPPTDFAPSIPDAKALAASDAAGLAALSRERFKFLKARYGGRLEKDPGDLDARLQLGIVEYQSGKRDAAVADFLKVVSKDPKNAAALNNLGSAAFAAGDWAGAEARFLAASASDPEDPDVWLNLLKTELKLKNADKAREFGAKAAALEPGYKPFVDGLTQGL
jgi:DNA-binding beta-propeller fold protein YncE/tetratricopeptide (TPR) repeat protein